MNCFNGAKYLRQAIDSVLAQDYQDWELIFWDNQSADDSTTIATSFGDARIKIYHAARHVPLGAARNEALAHVNGEWIAFLDTDDLWHPEKLRTQISYAREHPGVDFLYTNFTNFEGAQDWRRLRCRHRSAQPVGSVFEEFLGAYPVNLQTVMLRSAPLRGMAGWFPVDFEVAEELDLFLRFLYKRKAGYLPQSLVGYRLHPQQASRLKIARYAVEIEQVLKKLKKLYPESVTAHAGGYARLDAKITYYYARAAAQSGDKRTACALLAPLWWRDWRFTALYLLLRAPGNLFAAVHRFTGRYY